MSISTLELVYIWFNASMELYDLEVTYVRSPNDPDCAIPEGWGKKWSVEYHKKLKRFVNKLFGTHVFSSHEWKMLNVKYSKIKNKQLFEIYEELSEKGEFVFIWEFLEEYTKQDNNVKNKDLFNFINNNEIDK